MLYWIAGFVVLAAVFYAYLVLTARPDPYEALDEAPEPAAEPADPEPERGPVRLARLNS